jgi:hypothetical protein
MPHSLFLVHPAATYKDTPVWLRLQGFNEMDFMQQTGTKPIVPSIFQTRNSITLESQIVPCYFEFFCKAAQSLLNPGRDLDTLRHDLACVEVFFFACSIDATLL